MKSLFGIQLSAQLVLLCLLAGLVSGCSTSGFVNPQPHNLYGRIWDRQAGDFITKNQLIDKLMQADFVLLGETHDNPEHHAIEREVLQALADKPGQLSLVLEMLDLADQPQVDRFLETKSTDTAEFNKQSGFAEKGWDWPLYEPLIAAALDRQLPIVAGNLSRKQLLAVMKKDISAAPLDVRTRLAQITPLAPLLRQQLMQDIRDSHCGKLPEKIVPGMTDAQIARDIMLAEQTARAGNPALLIAGSGHVRRDRGVPFYLSQFIPDARIISVGMLGLDDRVEPAALAIKKSRFDYLWFTHSVDRKDPCAEFKVRQSAR